MRLLVFGLVLLPFSCESLLTRRATNRIVSSLVRAQPLAFLKNLARWILVAVPATYTNSMLVRPSLAAAGKVSQS